MSHFWAMSIISKFVCPELNRLLNGQKNSKCSQSDHDVNIDLKMSKERPTQKVLNNKEPEDSTLDGPLQIPYADLERVTNCWSDSNLLGRGGFGMVYQGVWLETKVAIKRIKKQGSVHNKSLFTELRSLSSMVHENILPLYGYSRDGEYGCLVYQFMEGGTVEDRLQLRGPAAGTNPLSWKERHFIAVGVARGLNFLHCARDKPLVHGDIKSANILLDSRLIPKIGDFGLTRLGPSRDVTSVRVSQVHGTKPYLPDELLRSGKLSPKVDTYSFGIVLMELATGRRAWNPRTTPQLLRDIVMTAADSALADPVAHGNPLPTCRHLLAIARICCDENPKLRPEMRDTLRRLEEDCREIQHCATCSTRLCGSRHPMCRNDQAGSPSPVFLHSPPPLQQQPHLLQPTLQIPPRHISPARTNEMRNVSPVAFQPPVLAMASAAPKNQEVSAPPVGKESHSVGSDLSSSLASVSLESSSLEPSPHIGESNASPEWISPVQQQTNDPFSLPLVSIIHGRQADTQPAGAS